MSTTYIAKWWDASSMRKEGLATRYDLRNWDGKQFDNVEDAKAHAQKKTEEHMVQKVAEVMVVTDDMPGYFNGNMYTLESAIRSDGTWSEWRSWD